MFVCSAGGGLHVMRSAPSASFFNFWQARLRAERAQCWRGDCMVMRSAPPALISISMSWEGGQKLGSPGHQGKRVSKLLVTQ